MGITNTTKENLKDGHNKHHQRKLKRWTTRTSPKKQGVHRYIIWIKILIATYNNCFNMRKTNKYLSPLIFEIKKTTTYVYFAFSFVCRMSCNICSIKTSINCKHHNFDWIVAVSFIDGEEASTDRKLLTDVISYTLPHPGLPRHVRHWCMVDVLFYSTHIYSYAWWCS